MQSDRQAHRQRDRKKIEKDRVRHTYRGRHTDIQIKIHIDRHTVVSNNNRQPYKHTDAQRQRQTDKKTANEKSRQSAKQTDTQTDIHR